MYSEEQKRLLNEISEYKELINKRIEYLNNCYESVEAEYTELNEVKEMFHELSILNTYMRLINNCGRSLFEIKRTIVILENSEILKNIKNIYGEGNGKQR